MKNYLIRTKKGKNYIGGNKIENRKEFYYLAAVEKVKKLGDEYEVVTWKQVAEELQEIINQEFPI